MPEGCRPFIALIRLASARPERAHHSPVLALAGPDSSTDAHSRFGGRFVPANPVFTPSPRPNFLRGGRVHSVPPDRLPCADMAPKSAIGKKKKSPYMQFCADKRAEWKARFACATALLPPSAPRTHAPLTLAGAPHLVRSANDGFFVVGRPLARSTPSPSRARCSARSGRA